MVEEESKCPYMTREECEEHCLVMKNHLDRVATQMVSAFEIHDKRAAKILDAVEANMKNDVETQARMKRVEDVQERNTVTLSKAADSIDKLATATQPLANNQAIIIDNMKWLQNMFTKVLTWGGVAFLAVMGAYTGFKLVGGV